MLLRLIPRKDCGSAIKCLMINTLDGSCRSFNYSEQADLTNHSICLDTMFDVLWRWVRRSENLRIINCCDSSFVIWLLLERKKSFGKLWKKMKYLKDICIDHDWSQIFSTSRRYYIAYNMYKHFHIWKLSQKIWNRI